MRSAIKVGLSFGLTSGVITTLGLMIGLYAGTHSKLAVLGGILTIAIADSFSDALGIHISEESKHDNDHKHVWFATLAAFASKFVFALSFVIPLLIFELSTAVLVGSIWAVLVVSWLSYRIAKSKKESVIKVVGEHLLISAVVVVGTYLVGDLIAHYF